MGMSTPDPCIKGAACQALDALSSDRNGMIQLQTALAGIAGARFAGLENVMAQYLLPAKKPAFTAADIDKIKRYLKATWFDPTSPSTYFPGKDVADIYGIGLLKTIELSLQNNAPVDAWWALDHGTVDMLNFATPRQITLIIATPRPAGQINAQIAVAAVAPEPNAGYSTRHTGAAVVTRKLEIKGR